MKKIIFLTPFLISMQLSAQTLPNVKKKIMGPFWETTYEEQQQIFMVPVQPGLAQDCADYARYILLEAQVLTAEDLNFARGLPLPGQMKNNYEVDFRPVQGLIPNKFSDIIKLRVPDFHIEDPVVEIDFSTIKDIQIPQKTGTFTDLSKKLGLGETKAEWANNVLKITGRDLVCDLYRKNLVLEAKAQQQISLNASDSTTMQRFYGEIENRTFEIKNSTENNYVKAAMLGYSYSELLKESGLEDDKIKKQLSFLISHLFNPDTMELNENWIPFENRLVIHFRKTLQAGYGPVRLKM